MLHLLDIGCGSILSNWVTPFFRVLFVKHNIFFFSVFCFIPTILVLVNFCLIFVFFFFISICYYIFDDLHPYKNLNNLKYSLEIIVYTKKEKYSSAIVLDLT